MIYTLPHTILNSARRFPDRPAFKCGVVELTFSQMATRMNQLAARLHRLGVQKGDRVGVCLNRSIETAIAIYGVMHAGAIYVPLDAKAPAERLRFLIEDCTIKILISNSSQKRTLQKVVEKKSTLQTIIGLKKDWPVETIAWDELDSESTNFTPPFPILEQDPAYIIYTSGSTGVPKGIVHTHYSGLSYARLTADLYQLNEQDRFANHAPIHFDISTLGYFTAPLVGACTVIASDAHTILPASMAQLIVDEAITVWYSVPLALIKMLQKGGLDQYDTNKLRWVLYGGEAFPTRQLRELMEQWPWARYSNVYGPAETNQCTFYNLPGPPENDLPVPIGEIWSNTDKLILDENDKEVPVGEMGELLIRSATMMKGYWRQEELTARSMYTHQPSKDRKELFYRTGDLVRLDAEGCLHFMGRKDHQIKIRGYRVELDAVEVQLLSHSAVSEAAVFAERDEEEVNKIKAVVSLNADQSVVPDELKIYLKDKLPFYAIPESIKITIDFPRTVNGKINRKALKADFSEVR